MRASTTTMAGALLLAAALGAGACSSGQDAAETSSTTATSAAADGTAPTTTAVPLEDGEQIYVYLPEPGDCWEERRTDENAAGGAGQRIILKLECSQPHERETFGVVDVPDDSFPGDGALQALGKKECPKQFADYVGTPYELSELEMGVWSPSQVDWNQTYTHSLACYLYLTDGTKLTEAVRGTGR